MAAEARRPRLSADAGEAVLEQLAHERLGVGERGDAVADVADRRDAELLAQDARRAAVVGDGDDRGEVARVLLEPAQEGREAGPAADRDDPRPAGEEALLVDQLDERLVRPRRSGTARSGRATDAVPRRTATRASPTAADDQPAQRERQELERQRVDDDAERGPPGSRSRVDLAEDVGDAEGEEQQPERTRRAASA